MIVGDGPELDNLRQQANDLQLADSIRFIGAVYDPKTLGAYMNESSIYVLAGMGGLSINDAMTYGMPVLCAVCDSTERDLVMEGKNGYFFKDGDADSLAGRIRDVRISRTLQGDGKRIGTDDPGKDQYGDGQRTLPEGFSRDSSSHSSSRFR